MPRIGVEERRVRALCGRGVKAPASRRRPRERAIAAASQPAEPRPFLARTAAMNRSASSRRKVFDTFSLFTCVPLNISCLDAVRPIEHDLLVLVANVLDLGEREHRVCADRAGHRPLHDLADAPTKPARVARRRFVELRLHLGDGLRRKAGEDLVAHQHEVDGTVGVVDAQVARAERVRRRRRVGLHADVLRAGPTMSEVPADENDREHDQSEANQTGNEST